MIEIDFNIANGIASNIILLTEWPHFEIMTTPQYISEFHGSQLPYIPRCCSRAVHVIETKPRTWKLPSFAHFSDLKELLKIDILIPLCDNLVHKTAGKQKI